MKDEPTPEEIEEANRRWEEIGIYDDFLFSQLALYKDVCEQLLSIILGVEVELIEQPRIQDTMKLDHDARGIRLDVLAKSTNTIYDIEMQASDNKDLFERERLYRGIMDVNDSFQGMKFVQLKESVIIFICTFDPFGRGKSAYIQENYESNYVNFTGTGKLYHVPNKAKTIYLVAPNYKKEKNPSIRNFLAYVMGKITKGDEFVKMLEYTVNEIKLNDRLKGDYVKLMLRDRANASRIREEEQAKALANEKKLKEEALAEKKVMMKFMLKTSTVEEINQFTGISLDLIEEVLAEMEE